MLTTEPNINLISTISLIDDENKVLIGKRPNAKKFPFLWEFPGGKVKKMKLLKKLLLGNPERKLILI